LKYRSFSQSDSEKLRDALIANEAIGIDQLGVELGDGELLNLESLRQLNLKAVARCKSGVLPEIVELECSGELYLSLRGVPVEIRDDAGFWRWVSASSLLEFLIVRDTPSGKPLGKEAIGAGTNIADILACRMFLRAQVARQILPNGDLDFSVLTDLGPKHHDFWQSHVVRVSTGSERNLAQALIDSHRVDHIPTSDLRKFVRDRINRPKTTVATYLMSDDEAIDYVTRQRDIFSAENQDDDLD